MSSLDVWVRTVDKLCGSSIKFVSGLLSHFTLTLSDIILFWVTFLSNIQGSEHYSFIWDTELFPECESHTSDGQTFLVGCIQGTPVSTRSKLHFCLLLCHILLGVALADTVTAGSLAPPLHSRPRKVQRGSGGWELPCTGWDLEFAPVASAHFLWHWY